MVACINYRRIEPWDPKRPWTNVPKITILAAEFLGDSIVVASDCLETRASAYALAGADTAKRSVRKWHQSAMPGILWGFAGVNDTIGNPFGEWFSDKTYKKWEVLRTEVRNALKNLTIRERQDHKETTQQDWLQTSLALHTEIVIAGHLATEPGILRFSQDVKPRWETPASLDEPMFTGTAETAFLATWRMLRGNVPDLDIASAEGLRRFLEQSVNSIHGTERPVDIWRLVNGKEPEYIPRAG